LGNTWENQRPSERFFSVIRELQNGAFRELVGGGSPAFQQLHALVSRVRKALMRAISVVARNASSQRRRCRRDIDLGKFSSSVRMWRNKLPKAAASLVLMQAVLDRNPTRRGKNWHTKACLSKSGWPKGTARLCSNGSRNGTRTSQTPAKVDCDGRAAQTYVPQDILNWVETSREPSGRFPMLRRNNSLIR
jgi:hypothetical protein